MLDLGAMLNRDNQLNMEGCHGLSFWDELQLGKNRIEMPERLIFFGVEVEQTDKVETLSATVQEKLPSLAL